jgi:branched-chain amino acid transport system ATP-binding protein
MLRLDSLSAGYGAIAAVRSVSLEVDEGEWVAIVGANGAGKSSLLKAITGLLPTTGGEIRFRGERLNGCSPDQVVRRGLTLVPEGRQIFSTMTVADNLELGAYCLRRHPKVVERNRARVLDLFPVLAERRLQVAGTLSGGEQQMLAIGRALMSEPKLLALDEPSLGLAPLVVREILGVLFTLNRQGIGLLLVEQDIGALAHASRSYVLQNGRVVLSGPGRELLDRRQLLDSYLGNPVAAPVIP